MRSSSAWMGTTNCKAAAVSQTGEVIASAACHTPMQSPRQGWVQQDAAEVWRGAVECLRGLLQQVPPAKVSGLSLSGAMHSLLPVDAGGTPLAPAMTWADQRAAEKVRLLRAPDALVLPSAPAVLGLITRPSCVGGADLKIARAALCGG
jgi:gluconokinase